MKSFLSILFLTICCSAIGYSQQNETILDSIVVHGGLTPYLMYTLAPDSERDSFFKQYDSTQIVCPLVVVNNIILRDSENMNYFRNNLDYKKLKQRWVLKGPFMLVRMPRVKLYTKEKAEKKGFTDVPEDGMLFLKTKRGYYIDLKKD